MGERSDGTWAAKQVGVSAPRQNGKSQLIVARALAGALLFGEKKIVISAHQQDTARETFAKFIEQIETSPALDERIEKVMNALNREFIKFKNGATIQFKARSGPGGRGFSADCLLLDEAQILGMPAWVSINSTMSARPNPQIWLLGTPPTPEDNGEVFTSIRTAALAGKSTAVTWAEWSADPKADPALTETRASANPAWFTRINHEVVQGEYETYPTERFALDRLGIWQTDIGENNVFGIGVWESCADPDCPQIPDVVGVAVSLDRSRVSIGAAGMDDERVVVGVVDRRDGVGWAVAELKRIQDERGCEVAIDPAGPSKDLIVALEAAGVRLTLTPLPEACAAIYDAANEGRLGHPDDPDLNAAVAGAAKRDVGDRWAWARKKSSGDLSILEAVTVAARAALLSAGSDYDVMSSVY